MSYQDTLARLALLKGVKTLGPPPVKPVESYSGSFDSAPAARFDAERATGAAPVRTAEIPESLSDGERKQRDRQCERIYRALSREVMRTVPREVAHHPPAWPVVEPPVHRLFEVARAYTERRQDRQALLRAAREVRHAWTYAAAMYERAAGADIEGAAA